MITSALLRTETERWREEYNVSRPAGSYRWVPWQAWHDTALPMQREMDVDKVADGSP